MLYVLLDRAPPWWHITREWQLAHVLLNTGVASRFLITFFNFNVDGGFNGLLRAGR